MGFTHNNNNTIFLLKGAMGICTYRYKAQHLGCLKIHSGCPKSWGMLLGCLWSCATPFVRLGAHGVPKAPVPGLEKDPRQPESPASTQAQRAYSCMHEVEMCWLLKPEGLRAQ